MKNDLTGQTFGRLTVLRYSHSEGGYRLWVCKCLCGNEIIVFGRRLSRGDKKSCGCLRGATLKNKNKANICIDCKKSCGGCSWSAADPVTGKLLFEPVPGWTAKKVKLRLGESKKGVMRYIDTYSITACPLFEKDDRKVQNVFLDPGGE